MGGLFYGFVCGMVIIKTTSLEKNNQYRFSSLSKLRFIGKLAGCIILLASLKTSSLYLFLSDGYTSPCPACRYTLCISFPPWNDMKDKWWYCGNCVQTTADAQVSDEGYYSVLKMSCPDESEIQFEISYLYINDRNVLQQMLPSLCREYCEYIYV